jgi:hypothetical protein
MVGEARSLKYHANSIGHIAFQALSEDQVMSILGTTSKGIFIRTAGRWIVFVSFEPYRSPLTITIAKPTEFPPVTVGAPVLMSSGKMVLPSAGVAISAHLDAVWYPPAASDRARPVSERLASLRHLAQTIVSRKESPGLGTLLPSLLGLPVAGCVPRDQESVLSSILLLRQTLREGNLSHAADIISGLLGMGRGLTPSGDDCVVGLLLLLNRWQNAVWPGGDLRQLNLRVVEAAYQITTTLSANLIECAAGGGSDERLVNVADGLLIGNPGESECISYVLEWGDSSGVDALVGMAVALTL